ncbi:hypothetical protein ACHWQZ_G008508, partial [Mnemiopsis leidyi]
TNSPVALCWISDNENVAKFLCELGPVVRITETCINFLAALPLTSDRLIAVAYPLRYKGNRSSHRTLIVCLITLTWLLPAAHGAVAIIYLSVWSPTNYIYKPATCTCTLSSGPQPFTFLLILLIFPTMLFLLLPTLFNLGAYSFIIVKIVRFKVSSNERRRTRQVQTITLAIRAFLIVLLNLLSWLPFLMMVQVYKDRFGIVEKKVAVFFLYINCIADPFLYVFSKKLIFNFITWCHTFTPFYVNSHSFPIVSKKSESSREPVSLVPKLAINAITVISASGLFFEEDVLSFSESA